ncbi:S8 family serine peptidase [Xanthomonas arboricola]|uniref:S8 family serine peptidase n=1 Tax=Xanthomonas arboricola TaxID=56448 RepID=UPI0020192178|nr:S8 family serine peptidase [Xanthomonas arboricola]UQQ16145.1 S8 family serine peptidase [Xanthomonas arboricola pv. corylina]
MSNRIPLLAPALLSLSLGLALPAAHAQSASTPLSVLSSGSQSRFYDGLIVTYRNGSTERRDPHAAAARLSMVMAAPATRTQWSSHYRQSAPSLQRVRRLAIGADLVRPNRRLSDAQLDSVMQALKADPSVAHVEPNLLLQPIRSTAMATVAAIATPPNDPGFEVQWHLRAPDGHLETLAPDTASYANRGGIDLLPAWQYGDGSGVVVAVIDTGITQHPDLDLSLADAGYDFISNAFISGRASDGRVAGGWDTGDWTSDDKYLESNGGCAPPGQQSDSSWHGTHVAGTIAMLTNNALGMVGIAPQARILPVRALGHCGGTTADIADAIVWASGGSVAGVPDNPNPAEVINMSLGGPGICSNDTITAQAIAAAIARGTTVVVAAGNDGIDAGGSTPASCPGVINVAATGITGKRAFYSSYGNSVTLAGPGGGVYPDDGSSGTAVRAGLIWSSLNRGTHAPGEPSYAGYSGTSMAAPHVAGVAASAISAAVANNQPVPTPARLREILTQTSIPFPVKPTLRIGAGILNANAAVARAAGVTSGGGEQQAVLLSRGATISAVSATAGEGPLYRLDVPVNARNLQIRTLSGRGQVKLYVRTTRAPGDDGSNADYSSTRPGTTQSVQLALPATDSYFIRVVGGTGGYSNLSIMANYAL